MSQVVVTGMGAISSLGMSVQEQWLSLFNSQTGIGKAKYFKSKYAELLPFGEVDCSDELLKSKTNTTDLGVTRTTLLAMLAFKEAITAAGITPFLSEEDTAFVSASSVGGMCYTDELYRDANLIGHPSSFIKSYEGCQHAHYIALKYEIGGYVSALNTACSSSANALLLAKRLLLSGRAKRVIAGGVDCLAKYTVNGFNSLMILSDEPCKPFDEHRTGLNLGEGAAFLVLELEENLQGRIPVAKLTGAANNNDAFHPSATSDEAFGPTLAMKNALRDAKLSASAIHQINAHGTGTPNNDVTESIGFRNVFKTPPPFISTKSYTGHTLAAAGALESIFSILCMNNNFIPKSLELETPLRDFGFSANGESRRLETDHVMTNSFGFGGNCTSLIFSKCT